MADALVEFVSVDQETCHLHIEIQDTAVKDLPRRDFVYHHRIDDRIKGPPEMLLILTDENPKWESEPYIVEKVGYTLRMDVRPVKLLDWDGREEELLADPNPVALFVQAHLWSKRTKEDFAARRGCKLRLIRELVSRKMSGVEFGQWRRYLEWLLPLAGEELEKCKSEVKSILEEPKMPWKTDLELLAEEKADLAVQERDRAVQNADRAAHGLRDAASAFAQMKFGHDDLRALLVGQPLDVLEKVMKALPTATGIEQVRGLIP